VLIGSASNRTGSSCQYWPGSNKRARQQLPVLPRLQQTAPAAVASIGPGSSKRAGSNCQYWPGSNKRARAVASIGPGSDKRAGSSCQY
jgi:hypothetical protein